jgi:hypothetical protein
MKKEIKLVEVARSFSYKLNVGNFESRDFFCSQKAECEEDKAEETSEALHSFCKEQVMKAVNEHLKSVAQNTPEEGSDELKPL